MSKPPNHVFQYPKVREIGYTPPHAFGIPEHDPFNDGLCLNDLGGFCIIAYAKSLIKASTTPGQPANVVNIEDYRRYGSTPPHAA